jgi:hypothetical protein
MDTASNSFHHFFDNRSGWFGLAGGLLLMMVANLMLLGFIFVLPGQPVRAPVHFMDEMVGLAGADEACPGDVFPFDSVFRIDEPAILEIIGAIIDRETGLVVPGTEEVLAPRPKPFAGESVIPLAVIVPDFLEPGDYYSVGGVSAKNMGASPTFVVVPFTVKEGCE